MFPRRRRRLLVLFIVLCAAFLLIHSAFHYKLKTDHSDAESNTNAAFLTISEFVDICHNEALPVFLVEPRVVNSLASANTSVKTCGQECPSWCHHLCTNHMVAPVTTFGIIGHVWKQMDLALDKFRGRHFFVTTQSRLVSFSTAHNEDDNFVQDVVKSIPIYFSFQHNSGHSIYLVIFHRRTDDKHLWHGQLPLAANTPEAFWSSDQRFGQEEGVFTSIDLMKVVLDGIKLRAPRYPMAFMSQMNESLFHECDQRRAEAFYREFGPRDDGADSKHFYTAARRILLTAKDVLDSLGIRFWLSSGTCLGWFRQCDLIPYSKDVDIGMWIKDYRDEVIPAMQNNGLELLHRFGKVEDSFELSFLGRDGVKLDIFFFYDEPSGYMWNGGTQARTGKKFKYIFDRFTLCWTKFLALTVRVPCDTEAYVTANYGKDWFRPVKSWDWKHSPPNVHENGQWPQHERDTVIQQFY